MTYPGNYNLKLTKEEKEKFESVKSSTGYGIKKIFMAMVNSLYSTIPKKEIITEEED